MSNYSCEYLRNVNEGRTDWKVIVRIIREWRGSKDGEVFKGFNLLLLDSKNCRMQAFVPAAIADRIGRMVELGKIYVIKNFEVQDYAEKEKFRPVQVQKKIVLTTSTKISDIDESQIFIQKNMFDLFQFSDLKKVAAQTKYLTDVIGIMPKKEKLNNFKNRHGIPQKNIKFKLFDGRTKINVTFWDSFATKFYEALNDELEEPIILIIASGRVTSWNEHIDICNYSPTQFYLNYDHHTVHQLRKQYNASDFLKKNLKPKRKTLKLCTVGEIKSLGDGFIEDEVVFKGTIKSVENNNQWKYFVCTSCYGKVQIDQEYHKCIPCQRHVLEPNTRLNFWVIAYDESGDIKIRLEDRAVRTLLEEMNLHSNSKDNTIQEAIKLTKGKGYTMKLLISKENIEKKDEVFMATDIFPGFDYVEQKLDDQQTREKSESFTVEPSTSSLHLDDISQLNYNTK